MAPKSKAPAAAPAKRKASAPPMLDRPGKNGKAAPAKSKAVIAKACTASSSSQTEGGAAEGAAGHNDMPSMKDAAVVFTGELDGITRDVVEDRVKAAGGKVMHGVSGNTTFFVVGSHLDDGRPVEDTSKYKKYLELKAKGKKCPIALNEEQLMALLGDTGPAVKRVAVAREADVAAVAAAAKQQAWVDRHAPKKLEELMGNASGVKKLMEWLRDFDDVVLRGKTKMPRFKPGGGMPDNINARAVLISGPPGIGKTTASRLAVRLHGGYDLLEYNASDARGQKIIKAMAEGIADNHTLSFGTSQGSTARGSAKVSSVTRRSVIVMDEVDGMGGGDRGGNAALIKMIKKSKNPIICICNDHGNPKIRSLAFSCYDIRFCRPSKTTLAQRAAEIAIAEGLTAEPNALEALAESCGNDVRHMLNQLQVMSCSPEYRQTGVSYTDMKDHIKEFCKDGVSMLTPFEACKNLLTSSLSQKMSIRDRLDNFFVDHSLVHLLVNENYLNAVSRKPCDADLLEKCAKSAELFALGDIVSERIRSNQEWNLLPDFGMLAAVYPAHVTNGFVAFPEFPKFLGNYSKTSRARRLCMELSVFLRLSSTVDRNQLVSSNYLEVLNKRALEPLLREDIDGTAAVLDAYGLQREHLAEHLSELRQHLGAEDDFKLIDPKVKAAMTRELNSGSHAVRVVLPGSKKRKSAAPDADDLGAEEDPDSKKPRVDGEEEEGGEAANAASSDVTAADALVKVKKSKAKPLPNDAASAKTKAKTLVNDVAMASGRAGKAKAQTGPAAVKATGKAKASEPAAAKKKGRPRKE